ncbi:MAG: class I SAM-dependent methyltransferase [Hyphomonadaceae bacterium]
MPAANDAQFWNRMARRYAASPISDMAGYERTLEHTRRYLQSGHAVLEIGCGTGTTALKLAPHVARYVASDISPEMTAIGREKAAAGAHANLSFEVAAPEAPPWAEAAFDAVLAFNLLHLVKARTAALAGVHRVLKPAGVFISKTPCLGEANPIFRIAVPAMQAIGQAPYVAFFTARELEQEIEAAGFEIVERARHASRGKDSRPFLVARKV